MKFWVPIIGIVVITIVLIVAIATSGADNSGENVSDDSQIEMNFTDDDGNVYEVTDMSEIEE